MGRSTASLRTIEGVRDVTAHGSLLTRKSKFVELSAWRKDNATPLIDWGKYYEKDGKTLMPVSIQAHHSFVDGLHIGQFVDVLQKYLDKI